MAKLTLQVKIIIAVAVVAVCAVTGGVIYHFATADKPEEPKETTSVAAEETEAETEAETALETETETEAETEKETEKATEKQTEKQTEKATKPAPKPTKPDKKPATTEKATKAPANTNEKTVKLELEADGFLVKTYTVKTTAKTIDEFLKTSDFIKYKTTESGEKQISDICDHDTCGTDYWFFYSLNGKHSSELKPDTVLKDGDVIMFHLCGGGAG